MTAQDIIQAAMRKLVVYASGETPSANELADGLSALQSMLRKWAGKHVLVFASTKESVTLTPTQYLYTWGTGGYINTTRPYQVLGAYILDGSGTTHPVDLITEGKYRDIGVPNTTSRPYALFFHPTFPLAEVYLYPVPSDAEALYLDSFKPFTETSSFDSLNSTLSFPPNYEEAIIYNLAMRLADEFGKTISPTIVGLAKSGYEDILILNSANQVETINIITPASSPVGSRYSINSDSYH